jgi:hypothetical protein
MTPLTAKSLDGLDNIENDCEETSLTNDTNTNFVDSSNNQLIALNRWSSDDYLSDTNEESEKIYEDLCYVTFSSSLSDEVFIPLLIVLFAFILDLLFADLLIEKLKVSRDFFLSWFSVFHSMVFPFCNRCDFFHYFL